jgi:hypothetical protein
VNEATIEARIRKFRRERPAATFHQWLRQLTPEDITKSIAASKGGTGIWRVIWDQTTPGNGPASDMSTSRDPALLRREAPDVHLQGAPSLRALVSRQGIRQPSW